MIKEWAYGIIRSVAIKFYFNQEEIFIKLWYYEVEDLIQEAYLRMLIAERSCKEYSVAFYKKCVINFFKSRIERFYAKDRDVVNVISTEWYENIWYNEEYKEDDKEEVKKLLEFVSDKDKEVLNFFLEEKNIWDVNRKNHNRNEMMRIRYKKIIKNIKSLLNNKYKMWL